MKSSSTKSLLLHRSPLVLHCYWVHMGSALLSTNSQPTVALGYGNRLGMMRGYGYNLPAPTAEPTPIGATPIPVDEEIQITAQSVTWVAPAQSGTYTAVCTRHPGMSLSSIVKD